MYAMNQFHEYLNTSISYTMAVYTWVTNTILPKSSVNENKKILYPPPSCEHYHISYSTCIHALYR